VGTLPGRIRLKGRRARDASPAPLRIFDFTEDPPAKPFQKTGLAVIPCDNNPEKNTLCYFSRNQPSENIRSPAGSKGGSSPKRRHRTTSNDSAREIFTAREKKLPRSCSLALI
jgi:hypothetical protein